MGLLRMSNILILWYGMCSFFGGHSWVFGSLIFGARQHYLDRPFLTSKRLGMSEVASNRQAVVANWNLGLDDAGAPPFGGVLRSLDLLDGLPLNGIGIVVTPNQSLSRVWWNPESTSDEKATGFVFFFKFAPCLAWDLGSKIHHWRKTQALPAASAKRWRWMALWPGVPCRAHAGPPHGSQVTTGSNFWILGSKFTALDTFWWFTAETVVKFAHAPGSPNLWRDFCLRIGMNLPNTGDFETSFRHFDHRARAPTCSMGGKSVLA
jgi:hypothetical protein